LKWKLDECKEFFIRISCVDEIISPSISYKELLLIECWVDENNVSLTELEAA